MKSQTKIKCHKKMKRKNVHDSKMSELNQYQCQTMSVLQNVNVRQCNDLVIVRLR